MLRRHGPFVAAVLCQLVLLAIIPARQLRARHTGTDVTLMTRPVDPYDVLSGYYVTLGYAVEQVPKDLQPKNLRSGMDIWLELGPAEPAWTLIALHTEPPTLNAGHVAIRGIWRHYEADLPAASRLYIPESDRQRVETALRQVNGRGLVDLRIASDGTAAVLRLRVGPQSFGD